MLVSVLLYSIFYLQHHWETFCSKISTKHYQMFCFIFRKNWQIFSSFSCSIERNWTCCPLCFLKFSFSHLCVWPSNLFFRHLGSISSTFYKQLLRSQIPNAQKRQSSWLCRLVLLEPMSVKAARKTLVKWTSGVTPIQEI